ncbi:MAG: DUF1822 family protein [Spirulinaceae cyanobacterium SM2_1_0]|nr:DUF1822 family protein [Spirulinaceae cyanobacterium SM2_1_0]
MNVGGASRGADCQGAGMKPPSVESIVVPLSVAAREAAKTQAAQQATPERGLQVYLNSLATWAVQRYLRWLAIASQRQSSESAQPVHQALFDVADLTIPGVGRLECRPLRVAEAILRLPPEVQDDRLGYVAVQFAESLQTAQLLGFLPAERLGDRAAVPLNELQPLENLLTCLSPAPTPAPIQLQQWLAGIFAEGWQAVSEILTPPTPGLAWRRATVQRARVLEGEPPLALCLMVEPGAGDRLELRLHLFPLTATAVLPPELRLRVLTATGKVFRELTVAAGDRGLQYEFNAECGESFAIEIQSEQRSQRFDFTG